MNCAAIVIILSTNRKMSKMWSTPGWRLWGSDTACVVNHWEAERKQYSGKYYSTVFTRVN